MLQVLRQGFFICCAVFSCIEIDYFLTFVPKRVETFSCIEIGFLMIRAFCPLCSEYKVRDSFLLKPWAHPQAVEKRGEGREKLDNWNTIRKGDKKKCFGVYIFIVGKLGFHNICSPTTINTKLDSLWSRSQVTRTSKVTPAVQYWQLRSLPACTT